MLDALDKKEQGYSVDLGSAVITEVKLELVCEDQHVEQALRLIREQGRTGQPDAGWVYVTAIGQASRIDG